MKYTNESPDNAPKKAGERIKGGLFAIVGFILSPLSWWNDLFVNIPLAYLVAWPFGLISQNAFLPAMIIGYWLTNIAGMVLFHLGIVRTATGRRQSLRETWVKDLLVSLAYTAAIVTAVKLGWLKIPSEYFRQ